MIPDALRLNRAYRSLLALISGMIALLPAIAQAQVIPDNSLGAERSTVRIAPVNGRSADLIEGGARRGANLFHSFLDFDIGNGQQGYFVNPAGVERILSRVTGSSRSDILGTLGMLGNADLFFLNPNGILFGPNAALDVRGSFVGSTTDSVVFENGFAFSASNPQAPPLLTINVPVGLQYGIPNTTGTITNAGQLAVGQDLTLLAGTLDLQGQLQAGGNIALQAQNTLRIRDTATQPVIISSGGRLLAQGNQSVDIFALNHPDSGFFSGRDMVLRSPQPVIGDAHFWSGGSFRIEQSDGSLGALYSPNDPVIRANGDVSLASYTGASLHILAGGSVTIPGNIFIDSADTTGNSITETVTLSDGTTVAIAGNTIPTLDIRAGINWDVPPGNNIGGIVTPPPGFAATTGSTIRLGAVTMKDAATGNGGMVFLSNQYRFRPGALGTIAFSSISTSDLFRGGSVIVDATADISIARGMNTYALTRGNPSGDITLLSGGTVSLLSEVSTQRGGFDLQGGGGGNLRINARNLMLTNRALLSTGIARNNGFVGSRGGDINITIADTITLSGGSVIINDLSRGSTGESGNTIITAGSLTLLGGSRLQQNTFNRSNAGRLTINVSGNIALNNSFIVSQVGNLPTGQGGTIDITANSLSLVNLSSILANTFGTGNAGNIRMRVAGAIALSGRSLIDSSSEVGAIGNGGLIDLAAGSLNLTTGSAVASATRSSGDAGSVTLNIRDAIVLDGSNSDGALISSQVQPDAEGDAGDIEITTGSLSLLSGQISSSTFGRGDAGRVVIRASGDVRLDGNNRFSPDTGIFSSVITDGVGNGNEIDIQARSLTVLNGAEIIANTRGRGNAGRISLEIAGPVLLSGTRSGIFSSVYEGAIGNGGSTTLQADSLTLSDNAAISTITVGRGNAGPLSIRVNGAIDLTGNSAITSAVDLGAVGNSSTIDIQAQSLSLRTGSQLVASTNGVGDSGRIVVQTMGAITLSDPSTGIFGTVNAGGVGNGSAVDIQAQSLAIANEAFISTEIFRDGRGNAGSISVRANDAVTISGQGTGIFSSVNAGGIGNGGAIQINARLVSLNSGAQVGVNTNAEGDAGTITVTANTLDARQGSQILSTTNSGGDARNITLNVDTINLTGQNTGLLANTTATATGQGGNIAIASRRLTVRDQARIAVNSLGSGQAGTVEVEATNARLSNRGSITAETVSSQGGNLTLRIANALRLGDRSEISASTATGEGGRLTINVNQSPIRLIELDRSLLATRVTGAGGEAGDLFINAERLSLLRRSEISASNLSSRIGGNIRLAGLARLQLDNSTISASTQTGQAGNVIANAANGEVQLRNRARLSVEASQGGTAGSLRLTANQVTLDTGAIASVSSPQGQAGTLTVNANTVRLDQGSLTAERGNTFSTNSVGDRRAGALIRLNNPEQLTLRNGSVLSALATGGANGGNIQINADNGFVVAVPTENSDIIASAEQGNGGAIAITTQGIFGLTVNESPIRIPESEINASSEAGIAGSISINTPDIGVEEIPELPNAFATPPLAQGCRASSRQNRFVNAGRGGVPRSPTDPLTPNTIWQDLLPHTAAATPESTPESTPEQSREEMPEATPVALPVSLAAEPDQSTYPILEAQGWVTLPDGTTALVTQATLVSPDGLRGNVGDRCFAG